MTDSNPQDQGSADARRGFGPSYDPNKSVEDNSRYDDALKREQERLQKERNGG